jgi:hypothetical protein
MISGMSTKKICAPWREMFLDRRVLSMASEVIFAGCRVVAVVSIEVAVVAFGSGSEILEAFAPSRSGSGWWRPLLSWIGGVKATLTGLRNIWINSG